MYRFIRWYNQNRTKFWLGFIIIALSYITIRILNGIVAEENEQKRRNINVANSSTDTSTTISNTNTSVITGEAIPNETSKTNENIIKEFIEHCNKGEIEYAYNMLSEECKSLSYPTIEKFKENYYQKIFYIQRMYKLENWYTENKSYTYHITYTEDVLATGNVNSTDNKADYITIVRKQNENKININSYIGRQIYNQSISKNGVTITINWLDMYMDYTMANISIKNNSDKTICLDSRQNNDTTYLYDGNKVKYIGLLNEIANEQLIVRRGLTNTINIKFNKIFNPEREVYGIIFADIVTNYEEYITNAKSKEKMSIIIEM